MIDALVAHITCMTRRRPAALVALALAVVVPAGCGGSDDESGQPPVDTPSGGDPTAGLTDYLSCRIVHGSDRGPDGVSRAARPARGRGRPSRHPRGRRQGPRGPGPAPTERLGDHDAGAQLRDPDAATRPDRRRLRRHGDLRRGNLGRRRGDPERDPHEPDVRRPRRARSRTRATSATATPSPTPTRASGRSPTRATGFS